MATSGLKEAKTEVLRGKIEIIKTAYPKIFENTNTLATILNTATAIISRDGTPYDFQGETTQIAPFNKFSFRYETYETMEQSSMKRKWKLHIDFARPYSDNDLVFLYMGDRKGETQEPQPADKLFLHFLSEKTRVIFDLKNHKIGFANDSNKTSYKIEDYPTVFDQIANKDGLLSDFNENSLIKIYGIEIEQERNIVAFRCKGGLFGETEQTITLPLKMEVKPGEIFKSSPILDEQPAPKRTPEKKPIRMEVKPDEPVPPKDILEEKPIYVVVDNKNIEITRWKNSVTVTIGELELSLRELKFLYYKYIRKSNDQQFPDSISISLISRNHVFISQKYNRYDYANRMVVLLEEAIRLEILNKDFIKKLEEVLAKA